MASYQYVYTMRNLTKSFLGGRGILKEVTLAFLPGAKIGVLGVNGAGKSTLMKIMAGEDQEFAGDAWAEPIGTIQAALKSAEVAAMELVWKLHYAQQNKPIMMQTTLF